MIKLDLGDRALRSLDMEVGAEFIKGIRSMPRAFALAVLSVAAVASSLNPTNCGASSPDAAATEPLRVVVLPAKVHAVEMRMVSAEESREWGAEARMNVDAALRELVDQSQAFVAVELPELSPEQLAAIEEFVAVANLASTRFGGSTWFGSPKAHRATADRELGPSLAFLQERTDASYAIGAFGFQQEQSKAVAATGAVATVATALTLGLYGVMVPPVTFSYLTVFVANLQTGELRWFNSEKGFEVAGFNFTDLRDPESASKMVRKVLEEYPESTASRARDSKPGGASTRSVSPLQGEFRVELPAGWRTSDDVNTISATRDGRGLNEMKVELRSHDQAFPASGQQTTKGSTSAQLVEWFVADLHAQDFDELQIIDVSEGSKLAGRPAFRVHFSHRLPTVLGGARAELVAIGAAVPRGLLIAQLEAAQLGYFAKVLPAFEESVETIELRPRRHLH
jgi:hypothetical protein